MEKKDFDIEKPLDVAEQKPLFEPPEKVGHYTLVGLIESESHSKVYFTMNSLTQEKMVIKVFDKTDPVYKLYTPDLVIWQTVNFPSIVPIAAIIDEKDKFAYLIPYYGGGDLYDFLQLRNKLTLDSATFILWDLVTAVNYLHQNGIVHGNIRPENILLQETDESEEPHAVLCGITRARRGEIPIKAIPNFEGDYYTDPALGEALNFSTDIFALGTVFYLIFKCLDIKERMEPEEEAQYTKFKDLLSIMLKEDPTRRCKINDVLCHDFFTIHTDRIGKSRAFVHFNGVVTHVCQVLDEGEDFIQHYEPDDEDDFPYI